MGRGIEFKAASGGAYTGGVVQGHTDVCLPVHIRVTGGDGHYAGSEVYYVVPGAGTCGATTGTGRIALAIASE